MRNEGGYTMKTILVAFALIASVSTVGAEEKAPTSTIDSITKSARDMMPSLPSMPLISLPSMPDISLPDLSDPSGRLMTEFNSFTQQLGDALPILEQMGYEVTTFKVTWGLPPKARLRLKSSDNTDLKVSAVAAKATGNGVLVSALISSAATAKRIQSSMKLGTAYLDVDFAVPPRVNMKFVNSKGSGKEDVRDLDDLDVACKD
jgi:hypothetical protein